MKITLRIFGVIGLLLFGSSFLLTYGVPGYVEEAAETFIKNRVEEETNEKIESLGLAAKNNKLVQIAGKLLKGQEKKVEALKQKLKDRAHEKLADVIAEMKGLSCECRKTHAQRIKNGYIYKIALLESTNVKLVSFMKTKYMDVINNLKTDLRIFTGSNTVMFLMLILLSFLNPKAISLLFLPGTLLFTSTIVCSYFYLFEQNWFFTLIYNDFVGYGYLGYIGVLFLFLSDIAFNKGRVTCEILNGIFHAIGSVAEVSPC